MIYFTINPKTNKLIKLFIQPILLFIIDIITMIIIYETIDIFHS